MAVALSACTTTGTLKEQGVQSGALKAMHKTERKAEKAGQVVVITGAAFVSAVEKKKQADKEHKEAKREFLQIVETIK